MMPVFMMTCFAGSGIGRSVIFMWLWFAFWVKRYSMCVEKFFCTRICTFLFVFEALLLVLYSVFGSVFAVLGCASMLVSVTFYVG